MRVLAILLWLIALGLLGLSGWALFTEVGFFGLPYPKGGSVASMLAGILFVVAGFLFPRSMRSDQVKARLTNMSDRQWSVSGAIWVIVATGFAALISAADLGRGDPFLLISLILIAVAFGIAAFLAAKFIARHGDEIGEARFDTRNPEEG